MNIVELNESLGEASRFEQYQPEQRQRKVLVLSQIHKRQVYRERKLCSSCIPLKAESKAAASTTTADYQNVGAKSGAITGSYQRRTKSIEDRQNEEWIMGKYHSKLRTYMQITGDYFAAADKTKRDFGFEIDP